MPKNLKEAVNIENAIHIGTAKGYDLFDILTYEAAQEFFNGDSDTRAGQAYTRDETTFNSNINEHRKLYFFTKENTRNVYAGAVIISQASSRITIKSSEGEVELYTNFLFEAHPQKGIIPLFLIPNIKVDGAIGNLIIRNNVLEAVLPQLTDEDIIADLDLTKFPQISAIKKGAFDFMPIINLKIGEDVKTVPENAFSNVQSIIVDWIEKPSGWHDSWHGEELEKITYTYQDEIIRRIKEAEEAEEDENRRIEQERQTLIRNLNYRKEGKGITILGINPSFEGTLTIPSTIENIPVTKIAQLAFYANPNIDKIYLPDSIKEIGKGAFALMNLKERLEELLTSVAPETDYSNTHSNLKYKLKKAIDDLENDAKRVGDQFITDGEVKADSNNDLNPDELQNLLSDLEDYRKKEIDKHLTVISDIEQQIKKAEETLAALRPRTAIKKANIAAANKKEIDAELYDIIDFTSFSS